MEDFVLQDFILKWNNTFILDRWYRKKYNIPFNSTKHRELNPLDIRFEFEEDLIFKHINSLQEKRAKNYSEYKSDGKLFQEISHKLSEEELIEAFDQINLDDLNKNINLPKGE